MTTKPVIYLAGPVANEPGGGADWRATIQQEYDAEYEFRNPLSKYNVPADDLDVVDGTSHPDDDQTVGVEEIVGGDKKMLRESNGVLVGYSAVHSIGTPMEVMWARERDYPVAIWVRDGTDIDTLSPWYRHHATALTTWPEAGLRHIERAVNGNGN